MLIAASFALAAFGAAGQSTDAANQHAEASAAAKATKAEDFAAKHKGMQDASKSSASSTGPSSEASKYKPSGKETMETIQSDQGYKGRKPVDKNAKATAPMKDVRKMTPEERAEPRKEVVKESKPDTNASVSPRRLILGKRVVICAAALELPTSCK